MIGWWRIIVGGLGRWWRRRREAELLIIHVCGLILDRPYDAFDTSLLLQCHEMIR